MELFFLAVLLISMAIGLGSGFPVAFALPGSAILAIALATFAGVLFENNADAYFYSDGPTEWLSAGVTNLRGLYWEVERDTLIAAPLFIFMGIMLQRSQVAEDLLVKMAQLFGPVPGGLGISVVFVGALLAATTGIVGATVVAMGLISLPAMVRNKYSAPLATGTIAASGTLGQIIPPSIVLIILADQLATAANKANTIRQGSYKEASGDFAMPSVFEVTSTSAGEMFLGALIPGLLLVVLYMVFILSLAFFFPKLAPSVNHNGKIDKNFWLEVLIILIPPLALMFVVLGSIIAGIATVNQAGALGAVGAIIMAAYRQSDHKKSSFYPAYLVLFGVLLIGVSLSNFDMNIRLINSFEDKVGIFLGSIGSSAILIGFLWSCLRLFRLNGIMQGVMIETAKTTSLVFAILIGAAILTAAFRAFGGEELIKQYLNSLPGGFWGKFIVVMGVIFLLGFFLDFIEISVVVVPLVAPILLADPSANITAVWLGVMIGLNIQTSFLTPPFGFALFYLRGVTSKAIKTIQMYKGVLPYILLQLFALIIVATFPTLVNYLPNRMNLLAEISPPPKNPKLQNCIEDYVLRDISKSNGSSTRNALSKLEKADFSSLPIDYQNSIDLSIKQTETALRHLEESLLLTQQIEKSAPAYKAQLLSVRKTEKKIRAVELQIKNLKSSFSRTEKRNPSFILSQEKKIKKLGKLLDNLKSDIPKDWKIDYAEFQGLIESEKLQRKKYRRLVDESYENISLIYKALNARVDFNAARQLFEDVKINLEKYEQKKLLEDIKRLSTEISQLPDTSLIASKLSKIARTLKKKQSKYLKIERDFLEAHNLYFVKLNLLNKSDQQPVFELESYLDQIESTIGVRQLARLPRKVALFVARCRSPHKDLSIYF